MPASGGNFLTEWQSFDKQLKYCNFYMKLTIQEKQSSKLAGSPKSESRVIIFQTSKTILVLVQSGAYVTNAKRLLTKSF